MGLKDEKMWTLLDQKARESDSDKPADNKNVHKFISGVEEICNFAINRAKVIRDTFPTYTLHDETHICNVLRLMEAILGDRKKNLTRDEAAMLIISACCHDIGMSYNDDDKQEALRNRDRLDKYLETHPAEYVKAYDDNNTTPILTDAMIQNYFRCIHHERVQDLLNTVEWPDALNGSVDRDDLIKICKSHGEDVSRLAGLNATPTVDLRMCAILLRLADILDFDTTRVPKSLYDYSGIATTSSTVTQYEWNKHYTSNGFNFSVVDRKQPYLLPFSANCKSMQIEHLVQTFINWIDQELENCGKILCQYKGRWHDLVLPEKIERRIVADGYVSGEYHLTLDHDQVLELLAGRHLYSDPSIFVRELLQNAIDAVRTRKELDKNLPPNWEPQIRIRTWTDAEGYQWFRIEDNGIGMTEETIRNYFLKIGRSYYSSSEFRKDKLRCNANPDYMPISRFGIGILSCFMGGDQIEVSTKRFKDSNESYPSYRLRMQGMNGYFYLADSRKGHLPGPMKGVSSDECDPYRNEPGTIVAVRTNLYKSGTYSGFKEMVSKYLLYPPVPVKYTGSDGECLFVSEQDFLNAVNHLPGSVDGRLEFGLSSEQTEELNHYFPEFKWEIQPKAIVQCAVFDRYLKSEFLNGVAISAWGDGRTSNKVAINIGDRTEMLTAKVDLHIDAERMELKLIIGYNYPDWIWQDRSVLESERRFRETGGSVHYRRDQEIRKAISDGYYTDNQWIESMLHNYELSIEKLSFLLEDARREEEYYSNKRREFKDYEELRKTYEVVVHRFSETNWFEKLIYISIDNFLMAHNGIVIETVKNVLKPSNNNLGCIVLLKDKFRPNMDISRNEVSNLNVMTEATLCLLEERITSQCFDVELDLSEFEDAQYRFFSLSQWLKVSKNIEGLSDLLQIQTSNCSQTLPLSRMRETFRSYNEIASLVQSEGRVSLPMITCSFSNSFPYGNENYMVLSYMTLALLRSNFKCTFVNQYLGERVIIRPFSDNAREIANIENFPVALFMDFSEENKNKFAHKVASQRNVCNVDHLFSKWLIDNQLVLKDRTPGILFELIRNVIEADANELIPNVKELLDKIKNVPNNPIPVPDDIYLTEDDFNLSYCFEIWLF